MATLAGEFMPPPVIPDPTTHPGYGLKQRPVYNDATGADALPMLITAGVASDTQPVDEIVATVAGSHQYSFGFLDWYNRIHVSQLAINLGNVVSAQEYEVFVFNAYFEPRTLVDVVQSGDEGLVLTQPGSNPLVYAPLKELTYLLSVAAEGAPTITGAFEFEFDVRTFTLTVAGVRVVAWQWEPNWIAPVLERIAWLTDVQRLRDGSEQRRQLREHPRGRWEFTYDVLDRRRRGFENVLADWGGRVFALPIWPDVGVLDEELPADSSAIPVDDPGARDYHAGGLALLIDATRQETVEVDAVGGDSITLARPTAQTWGPGTRVYPARTARLESPAEIERLTRNHIRGRARFATVEEIAADPLSEGSYRGQPVMVREPNWLEAPLQRYERQLVELDYGVGTPVRIDQSGVPTAGHRVRWTMLDRTEAEYFRAFVHARRGRQKGVWIPTWAEDLVVNETLGPSAVQANVEHADLTFFAGDNPHRRDVRIQLKDGTLFYRRVSGFAEVDADTELMTLDSPLGQTVNPSDIERVSWLYFVRLDQDEIEIAWQSAHVAEAVLTFAGPNNEL